jgi:diguanylate cyclase (GGDEF)-like protein
MFVAQGHGYLALCQARLGWPADARHSLRAATDIGAGEVEDLHRLLSHVQAAVLFAEGNYPEAVAVLTGCWTDVADKHRPPWTEDVAYLLARCAEATGDSRSALRWYGEVHERYGRADYEVALARAAAARLRVEQDALLRRSQQLESDSRSDPLTGVANRRVLDEALRRRVSGRRRPDRPTTVVVVDIDHFKQINDERGHLVGDQVLRQVGELLGEQVREDDVCARYGGDEFVLVLTATAEQAAGVAARATAEIARFPWGRIASELAVTVTCGLAERQPDHSPGTLFAAADADLLAAKRSRHRQHRPPVAPRA